MCIRDTSRATADTADTAANTAAGTLITGQSRMETTSSPPLLSDEGGYKQPLEPSQTDLPLITVQALMETTLHTALQRQWALYCLSHTTPTPRD